MMMYRGGFISSVMMHMGGVMKYMMYVMYRGGGRGSWGRSRVMDPAVTAASEGGDPPPLDDITNSDHLDDPGHRGHNAGGGSGGSRLSVSLGLWCMNTAVGG